MLCYLFVLFFFFWRLNIFRFININQHSSLVDYNVEMKNYAPIGYKKVGSKYFAAYYNQLIVIQKNTLKKN